MGQYYWHVKGDAYVEMVSDGNQRFMHVGPSENDSLLQIQGALFTDKKLLRVQERGQQNDLHLLTKKLKTYLLEKATQDDWFELALRFGKEMTLSEWHKEVRDHPKRKMVKLLGFDGGEPMHRSFVSRATDELMKYDSVIWDADWYCNEGWTGMIHTFLLGKPHGTAVAFTKKAEVPGFHRSYWELYKRFPNRIQIVVLNDVASNGHVCPPQVQQQQDWLADEYHKDGLESPFDMKWLNVATVGRRFQGDFSPDSASGGPDSASGGTITADPVILNDVDMRKWQLKKKAPVEEE